MEAAELIGVSKNTLLRWINEEFIPDVQRDWRGWRIWSEDDIQRAKAFKESYHSELRSRTSHHIASRVDYARESAESIFRFGRAFKYMGDEL